MAKTITLPDENEIGEKYDIIDVDAIHTAREFLRKSIATALETQLLDIIKKCSKTDPKDISNTAMADRSLENAAMFYLAGIDTPAYKNMIHDHFMCAGNMTMEIATLALLCDMDDGQAEAALDQFYQKWHTDLLVMDKWFSVQAASTRPGSLERIKALCDHPDFNWKNPNRIRSLIGVFGMGNPFVFHQKDGEGYRFFADQVIHLDKINPQVTARMVSAFNRYRRYDEGRRELMQQELQRIHEVPGLSRDVYEIVSRALGQ